MPNGKPYQSGASPDDVLRRNYLAIEQTAGNIEAIRRGAYHEAAIYARRKYGAAPSPDEIAGIYRMMSGNNSLISATPDFASFCLEFSGSGSFGFFEHEADDSEEPADTASVAYMQNTYSDRAFRIFSRIFERVTAAYHPGFREVCEEVYYGRSIYGILPVSSSNDGTLSSFQRLMAKYDLKIALEADVEMNDESVMRFALVKRGIGSLPASLPELGGSFRYMDLSVTFNEGISAGTFISALEQLGALVITVTSTPHPSHDFFADLPAVTVQLDISAADLDALWIFLEASHIRYDVSGLYDILN